MPLVQKYDLIHEGCVFDTVTRQHLHNILCIDVGMLDAEIDTMGHAIIDEDIMVQFHDRTQ